MNNDIVMAMNLIRQLASRLEMELENTWEYLLEGERGLSQSDKDLINQARYVADLLEGKLLEE